MEAVETMSLGRRLFGHDEQQGESTHLGDFLRIKEEEGYNYGQTNFSGQTLESILRLERGGRAPVQVQSSRTLLDIIRDDPINSNDNRKSWRHFKDRLRAIRLQGSGSGSDLLDTPIRRRATSPRDSNSASNSAGSDHPQPESSSSGVISNTREEAVGGETVEQPVRMSLMALLAENDRQVGFDGSAFVKEVEEAGEEEAEEKGGSSSSGGGEYSCCVCMVRHKGAAFIPCGHTFCRLCCREIWIQRGNCPLCNTLILEILDIF